jgi:signal peptidase I
MRRIREVLLTVGAVLGAVCLLLGLVAVTVGVHVLVFRSGSMSPTIDTGDLALTRTVSAGELRTDDVVSVIDAGGNRVTHRLVGVAEQGGQRQLTLQGDANEQPDSEIYTVTEAQRVVFVVPKAGYLVGWSTGPAGLLLLGAYGAFLVTVLLRRKDDDPDPPARRSPPKRRADRSARRGAPVLLAVVLGGAMATVPTQAWAAPWTDPVTVTGSTFMSYVVPKPAIVGCNVTGGALSQKTATITWTEVSSPFALDYTAAIVETSQSLAVSDQGATRQATFSAGLLSSVLNSTYNIRITAKLPSPNGSWTSVVSNQPVTIGLLGLSLSCGTAN